jgi:hypothetical protein
VEVTDSDHPGEWTAQQCADACGVQLKTWHSYVARGQAPPPVRRIGRTPLWNTAEVIADRDRRTPRMRRHQLPVGEVLGTIDACYEQSQDPNFDGDRVQAYRTAVTSRDTLSLAVRHLSEIAQDEAEKYGAKIAAAPKGDYGHDVMRADGFRSAYMSLAEGLFAIADLIDGHVLVHPDAE